MIQQAQLHPACLRFVRNDAVQGRQERKGREEAEREHVVEDQEAQDEDEGSVR